MAVQTVFRRYELKYLLTGERKARVLAAMAPYMALDRYGHASWTQLLPAIPDKSAQNNEEPPVAVVDGLPL